VKCEEAERVIRKAAEQRVKRKEEKEKARNAPPWLLGSES
jgi:hypothetical protein